LDNFALKSLKAYLLSPKTAARYCKGRNWSM